MSERSRPRAQTPLARRFATALGILVCWGVAGYGLVVYTTIEFGALVHPEMKASYAAHPWAIRLHIFASCTALLLGPLQFLKNWRRRHPKLHRAFGSLYLGVGILVGGGSGLIVATRAYGGWVAKSSFAVLAALWLYTGLRAFLSIRRHNFAQHGRWMVYNFALTLAAVTLRIYLPLSMVNGIPFDTAYPIIAWLCWVPNLAYALWSQRPAVRLSHAPAESS